MQNALLIGLSRQMTLERQMDVIANNVANANTNGFKADHSLFEEFLNSNAREDNFVGADRRVSYVQDRGTFRDVGPGPMEMTKNPLDMAISGDAYFAVQVNGGERYTRDGKFSLNSTGQLVTSDGNLVLGTGGPITFQPTDHDINIEGQLLGTRGSMGYVVTDVAALDSDAVVEALRALPETVRLWVLR